MLGPFLLISILSVSHMQVLLAQAKLTDCSTLQILTESVSGVGTGVFLDSVTRGRIHMVDTVLDVPGCRTSKGCAVLRAGSRPR